MNTEEHHIIARMQCWVTDFIVELNICPFALREVRKQSIRYTTLLESGDDMLYDAVSAELQLLTSCPEIETTILIVPWLDDNFDAFINCVGLAQQVIALNGLSGTYQVANFHPQYVFADSDADDPANYTNRAPHAALHLLRETSVARAIHGHKNAEQIPEQNIQRLEQLGLADMQRRFDTLFNNSQN